MMVGGTGVGGLRVLVGGTGVLVGTRVRVGAWTVGVRVPITVAVRVGMSVLVGILVGVRVGTSVRVGILVAVTVLVSEL